METILPWQSYEVGNRGTTETDNGLEKKKINKQNLTKPKINHPSPHFNLVQSSKANKS